jgi:hypothetical protein
MAMQGSTLKKTLFGAIGGVAMLSLVACGQDPSFLENEDKFGKKSSDQTVDQSGGETDDHGVKVDGNGSGDPANGSNNDGGNSTVGDSEGDGEESLPGGGGNDWLPDWADSEDTDPENPSNSGGSTTNGTNPGNTNNPGNTTPPSTPVIPGAGDDADVLYKCLAKWKDHPFQGTVNNYKKISASVSVGGFGNLINDTENTAQPYLILVEAAVNVLGAPTYSLMNRNGYYCMKVNVNVSTNLNINLHCNARLADQKVNVNVGSTQNSTTSAVGVHVLSNVQVNSVRPEGDTCIR